ncbi:MAG TPA: acyltransferase, partial [Edaphobacter sp.]|nr:acyltransferase [Edaphobacter sp.]
MAHARSEGPDFIKTDEKLPPSSELTPPNKHMPGLDVIRGLAIGGVIMYHGVVNSAQQFHSHISNLEYHSLNVFEIGYMGVPLFFVLSGFLITGILLDTRTNADYFKTFYVRRFLRIVPVYVLMIVLLKSLNEISWTFVLIALLYLSNMSHSAKIGKQYGAFWSLAVEEQFYLIWPLMIRKLSPRRSFYVATSLLFAIPVLRFVLLYLPHGFNDIYFKVWSVADFFAGGAVMAMAIRSSRLRSMLPAICVGTVALSAILFLLLYAASGAHSPVGVRILKATARSPWVFLFSGMVLFAYLKPSISKGALGQFLV